MDELVIVEKDHMQAVIAAVNLRRCGFTVHTFLTGSLNTQRKKAAKMSAKTITLEQAAEIFG